MNAHNGSATGKVMTVNGPIDPADAGVSIMHEHIFIDFWRDKEPGFNAPATDIAHWNEKLTLENLYLARSNKPIKDNYMLTDEGVAFKDLMAYRNLGGTTVVEVSNIGLGRDPLALQRISNATGLNIVMGSGWYQKFYHPKDMGERTVEDLTEEIIQDVTVGVGNTGVRSGIIGEVGVNGNPLTANEEKSIRASGRASQATGAAITFHSGGTGREKFQVAKWLAGGGRGHDAHYLRPQQLLRRRSGPAARAARAWRLRAVRHARAGDGPGSPEAHYPGAAQARGPAGGRRRSRRRMHPPTAGGGI